MRIVDVGVTEFSYSTNVVADLEGHQHPSTNPIEARLALLTIRAEDGCEGHCLAEPDTVRAALLDTLVRPILLGSEVHFRERIWQRMAKAQRLGDGRLSDATIGTVDMALWDLAGKSVGLPVYKLIGAYRDKVLAYGSTMCGDEMVGGLATPEDYARFAEQLVARGYKAIKLHTWAPPISWAPDPRRDAQACAIVREAVGPNIELMLDPHHHYDRSQALWLGRQIQDLDFCWYEEPMNEASMSSYKWLCDSLAIPVLGPETAPGKHFARAEWIRAGASDISRTGVNDVGGLSPSLKIVHLAEAFGMNCEIHASHPGNLTLCAIQQNGRWYERGLLHPFLDYDVVPPYLTSRYDPMDAQGYVHLPTHPGLGYNVDLAYIEENQIASE